MITFSFQFSYNGAAYHSAVASYIYFGIFLHLVEDFVRSLDSLRSLEMTVYSDGQLIIRIRF